MKRSRYIFIILSMITLGVLARNTTVQAFPPPATELNDHHYVRVVIPGEFAEELELRYVVNGEEKIAHPEAGEVVSLSIDDDQLESLSIPFATLKEGDDYTFFIGDPAPQSLKPVLGFQSTLETHFIDKESELVLHVPGGSVEIIYGSDDPQMEVAPDVPEPIVLGEVLKNFIQEGVLEFRFVIIPVNPDGDENTDGDPNDGNEGNPEAGATGGCSLASSGPPTGAFAWIGLLAMGVMGLIRRSR